DLVAGGGRRQRYVRSPGLRRIAEADDRPQRRDRVDILVGIGVLAVRPGERAPGPPVVGEAPFAGEFDTVDADAVAVLVALNAADRVLSARGRQLHPVDEVAVVVVEDGRR